MSVLHFFASIIGSLAWPVAVIVLVWLLKSQITTFVTTIRHGSFQGGGVKVVVERDLDSAETSLEAVEAEAASRDTGQAPERKAAPSTPRLLDLHDLVQTNPSGAILAAWERLKSSLARSVDAEALRQYLDAGRIPSSGPLARAAVKQGLLPQGTEELIRDLSQARYAVAHSEQQPDREQAERFVVIVERLLALLELGEGLSVAFSIPAKKADPLPSAD